jgi:hypothetical protein
MQEYFSQIRPIDDCTAEDGRFIGHMLMNAANKAPKAQRSETVAAFVSRTAMLREAPLAQLATLLHSVICKKRHRLLARDVAIEDPAQLTAADAETIGDGMTAIMRGHVSPAKAADEIRAKYPVLRAVARQCTWFEPMLAVIVARLMKISMGKTLRLMLSTVLSLLDVSSDISTITVYYLNGETLTASLILACVSLSIASQMLIVWIRYRHCSAREIGKELAIVLSFLKPVVDLRRLMHGHEVDGAPFDTATERNFIKGIETVIESFPSSVFSMATLLRSKKWAWVPVASIIVSWTVTAFKITSMSFDVDTDRMKRKLSEWFFGFVPDSLARRRIAWACLFVVSSAHLVERSVALTLLYVTNKAWLGGLLGAEIGLGVVFKVVRSDFAGWIRGMGFVPSLVYRISEVLVVNFTGLVHLRYVYELGGACWLIMVMLNQVVCLMSVWAYTEYYDGPAKLDRDYLFVTVGTLAVAWGLAFAGFLLSIERTYLWTFVSLETGPECIARYFRETEGNDEERILIFTMNPPLYSSIRIHVKAWCLANYDRWKREQPAWLTPGVISSIPDDCIPKERLADEYESALVRRHTDVRGLDGDLDC